MKSFGEITGCVIKPPYSVIETGQNISEIGKSVIESGKNVNKSAGNTIKGSFKIHKSNDDKMLAFGWANVAVTADGKQVTDLQEDIVDPDVLEAAAYQFVEFYREGGEMHERGGCAVLVESVMFTKEKMAVMGITEGALPEGWWIGFKVTDPDVWDKVKSGEYQMFSIEGEAVREEVTEETTE